MALAGSRLKTNLKAGIDGNQLTENDVYFTDINRLAVQDSAPESEHGVHTRPGKRLLKDCEKTGPLGSRPRLVSRTKDGLA